MTAEAVNQALARLRAVLPHSGADTGPDPVEDLITLINAAIENHDHEQFSEWTQEGVHAGRRTVLRSGYPAKVSGSHGEALKAVPGTQAPQGPPVTTEARRRLGKDVPTPEQVLHRVQGVLAVNGMPGYAPLSVAEGVEALARTLRYTQGQLATAEASSHRAQIAEHYREALLRLHDGHSVVTSEALQAPEWDKRIRP
jgi:hypothetical protein